MARPTLGIAASCLTLFSLLQGVGSSAAMAQYGYGYVQSVAPGYATDGQNIGCAPRSGTYGYWTNGPTLSPPAAMFDPYPGSRYGREYGHSPARRQGYLEGERYYETGIVPNHPLSPNESRGFAAGERRAASTPWQFDPIRQQGFREGEIYWETGSLPNRPLSPAEIQGFRAGERRAAAGYGRIY